MVLAAVVLLLVFLSWVAQTAVVQRALSIPSRYYAKEMCSCLFVLERDEAFCRNEVDEYVPLGTITIDRDQKRVHASGFGFESSASVVDLRRGCRLLP